MYAFIKINVKESFATMINKMARYILVIVDHAVYLSPLTSCLLSKLNDFNISCQEFGTLGITIAFPFPSENVAQCKC